MVARLRAVPADARIAVGAGRETADGAVWIGGIEGDASDLRALDGGAPDFATIRIRYVPAASCVELKSLKLYLWSFRNDGIFYERAVNRILDDLAAAVQPKSLEVVGDFNLRGGIKSIITARWPLTKG